MNQRSPNVRAALGFMVTIIAAARSFARNAVDPHTRTIAKNRYRNVSIAEDHTLRTLENAQHGPKL